MICCACMQSTETPLNHLVVLAVLAPDGAAAVRVRDERRALAVLCDACADAAKRPVFALAGGLGGSERIPVAELMTATTGDADRPTADAFIRPVCVAAGDPFAPADTPNDGAFAQDGDPDGPLADYLRAPRLDTTVQMLLADGTALAFLRAYRIEVLWRREGRLSNGEPVYAETFRSNARVRFQTKVDATIEVAADHCRALLAWQLEAVLYHSLWHLTEGKRGLVLNSHDFEGFHAEISRYGPWQQSLRVAAEQMLQLRMAL